MHRRAGTPHHTTPHLTSPYLTSPYLTSPCLLIAQTATLCSSSELDATEVWLIDAIERRAAQHAKHRQAISLVQRSYRLRRSRAAAKAKGLAPSWAGGLDARRHKLKLEDALQTFKRARLNSAGMQVTNIKTIDGQVRSIQESLQDIAARLGRIEARG